MISSRGESRSSLVTFVERKTRFLWAIKALNRTAKSLNNAFGKFMETFGLQVKSITVDHGNEVPMNILIDGYVGYSRKRPTLAK